MWDVVDDRGMRDNLRVTWLLRDEEKRRGNKHNAMANECPHAHFLPITNDPKRRDKGIMDGCLMDA